GSDDLIVSEEFRLRDDSSTQINDVVPEELSENATGVTGIEVGETMHIRGTTNRNPEDATIVVEATEGPSLAELGTEVTEEWSNDGEWNVSIEVPEDVEPGQYTIESDDGERVDEANVTIASEGTYEEGERTGEQLGELQNQIEELEGQVDSLESERDELQTEVEDLESTNEELESDLEEAEEAEDDDDSNDSNDSDDGEGQPGFTAVAALISLIAVALLAIRRQEE
ncbi:MAG: PGF-CTERM sorting domain-containing protein, partial [Halobacteriales archaeon]